MALQPTDTSYERSMRTAYQISKISDEDRIISEQLAYTIITESKMMAKLSTTDVESNIDSLEALTSNHYSIFFVAVYLPRISQRTTWFGKVEPLRSEDVLRIDYSNEPSC